MTSDYELMQQLNSTNIEETATAMGWLQFDSSIDNEAPSKKFGMGFFVGIFLGFIVFSAMLVVVIIWISKKYDDTRATKKKGKDRQHRQELKSNLICKPWCPEGASESPTRDSTEKSASAQDDGATADSLSCLTVAGEYDSDMVDIELQDKEEEQAVVNLEYATPKESGFQQKDGCVCGLCNEEYQPGQPVYESNNPRCRHEFHQICMERWLEFQNTCPTCNQPFALHTA